MPGQRHQVAIQTGKIGKERENVAEPSSPSGHLSSARRNGPSTMRFCGTVVENRVRLPGTALPKQTFSQKSKPLMRGGAQFLGGVFEELKRPSKDLGI
jgi:hypothetical protein